MEFSLVAAKDIVSVQNRPAFNTVAVKVFALALQMRASNTVTEKAFDLERAILAFNTAAVKFCDGAHLTPVSKLEAAKDFELAHKDTAFNSELAVVFKSDAFISRQDRRYSLRSTG